jgi:hypothetical protein
MAHKIQDIREMYIRKLAESEKPSDTATLLADDLFSLDLTVYSRFYSFKSMLYNSVTKSYLDESVSLHPEQIRIVEHIERNLASIISAPTSFGKTYCVFEYIARHKPSNVVLIVPTLALMDEYQKKIIKKHKSVFSEYIVHSNITESDSFDFSKKNLFVLTHDRVVQESAYSIIEKIDFLVIDEVYKLETDVNDDRVLILNMAYYFLAEKAEKYVLLAPFIRELEECEKLEKHPVLYRTSFSPVVNEVKIDEILTEEERFGKCKERLSKIPLNEKTLVYFPEVREMYKYVRNVISQESILDELPLFVENFIRWAKEEIHEEWCVVLALERGYLIHNGQIPLGSRLFQLDFFEQKGLFNRLLCTSSLLEGVNTTAKNMIIVKPSRKSMNGDAPFSAFDFFNLVGRTGRLNKYYVGVAYYIKSPSDPEYDKANAVKSIKFEISDSSQDIDIQLKKGAEHPDFVEFLKVANFSQDEYLTNIGFSLRFKTVVELYGRFRKKSDELKEILENGQKDEIHLRHHLIIWLYGVIENRQNRLATSLIQSLLNKNRLSLKKVIDGAKEYFSKVSIDVLISYAIKLKYGYIEHDFYKKSLIICFFMKKFNFSETQITLLKRYILQPVEYLYFINQKQQKMLLDAGIYERDIDKIIKIIGMDFDNVNEMCQKLIANRDKFDNISYMSKYVIDKMV